MTDPRPAEYDGVLERTADGGVIRFERHLRYSIEDVWDAITNPARLAEWWLPFDADVAVDLRAGGEMTMVGSGDEAPAITATILRVEPPSLLDHTHLDPGSRMRWELEAVSGGCILRLSHFVTDPDLAIGNCYVVGLHTSLARLAPCLAGTPVAWDWDEFERSRAQYAMRGFAPVQATP